MSDLFEFWSPTEVKNYVNNVGAGFGALDSDFKASNALDAANQKAWKILFDNFTKFQKSVGFFAGLTLSTVRTAEEYARQLIYWRGVYQSRSGRTPTGATVDIPAANQQAAVGKLILLAGIGLAAYVAVNAMQILGPTIKRRLQ